LIFSKLNIVFDVEMVHECYEFLNVMWLNDMYYIWMMKIVWNWCHKFEIMYELLLLLLLFLLLFISKGVIISLYINYEKPMFNRDPLASMISKKY